MKSDILNERVDAARHFDGNTYVCNRVRIHVYNLLQLGEEPVRVRDLLLAVEKEGGVDSFVAGAPWLGEKTGPKAVAAIRRLMEKVKVGAWPIPAAPLAEGERFTSASAKEFLRHLLGFTISRLLEEPSFVPDLVEFIAEAISRDEVLRDIWGRVLETKE